MSALTPCKPASKRAARKAGKALPPGKELVCKVT